MKWDVPKMWDGATVYILGGGPSLRDVDINRLRGQHIIAVNNAYQLASWIPMMYFMDTVWFRWHAESLANWPGIRVTSCRECENTSWVKFVDQGHRRELDERPHFMMRGTNAGFGAMAIAIKLGAMKVILLGFDMQLVNGNANWHEDHERVTIAEIYKRQFLKSFASVKGELIERGIEVINATPGSALTTFPIVSPKEVYPYRASREEV